MKTKTFISLIGMLAALPSRAVRLANKIRHRAVFAFDQVLDAHKDQATPCMANSFTKSPSSNIGTHNGQMPVWVTSAVSQRYLLYALSGPAGQMLQAAPITTPAIMPHGTVADETTSQELDPTNGYYNGAGVSGAEKALQILGNGLTKIMVPAAGYTPQIGDEAFATSGGYITARPVASGTYWKVGVIIGIDMDSALVEVADNTAGKLVI